MQITININWWENEGQDEIPETDAGELEQIAIAHVLEKRAELNKEYYISGELSAVVNGTYYNGEWNS